MSLDEKERALKALQKAHDEALEVEKDVQKIQTDWLNFENSSINDTVTFIKNNLKNDDLKKLSADALSTTNVTSVNTFLSKTDTVLVTTTKEVNEYIDKKATKTNEDIKAYNVSVNNYNAQLERNNDNTTPKRTPIDLITDSEIAAFKVALKSVKGVSKEVVKTPKKKKTPTKRYNNTGSGGGNEPTTITIPTSYDDDAMSNILLINVNNDVDTTSSLAWEEFYKEFLKKYGFDSCVSKLELKNNLVICTFTDGKEYRFAGINSVEKLVSEINTVVDFYGYTKSNNS